MYRSIRTLEATAKTMWTDLMRPHEFSKERVGFLYCRPSGTGLIGIDYHPVAENHYEPTTLPICLISSDAIRGVMERIYKTSEIVFHVHLHELPGPPELSRLDLVEIPKLLKSFSTVVHRPHGILLFGPQGARAWQLLEDDRLVPVEFVTVGFPVRKEL